MVPLLCTVGMKIPGGRSSHTQRNTLLNPAPDGFIISMKHMASDKRSSVRFTKLGFGRFHIHNPD